MLDACGALEDATGRKIWAFDVLHEAVNGDIRVLNLRAYAIDAFTEIVWRDVCRHAHGDTCAAVDEEVRESGWENSRFLAGLVIVRPEIDRALVHVVHECGSQVLEARLGVTHGRWWISLDGAKVSLPVNEHLAHSPRLGHMNECRVDRLIAVRVVVAHRLTDDFGTLQVFAVGLNAELVHRKKNAAL